MHQTSPLLAYAVLVAMFVMAFLAGASAFFLTFRKKSMPRSSGIVYLATATAACVLIVATVITGEFAAYFKWIVVCTGVLVVVGWLEAYRKVRQARDKQYKS